MLRKYIFFMYKNYDNNYNKEFIQIAYTHIYIG